MVLSRYKIFVGDVTHEVQPTLTNINMWLFYLMLGRFNED